MKEKGGEQYDKELKEINKRLSAIGGVVGRAKTKPETKTRLLKEMSQLRGRKQKIERSSVDYETFFSILKDFNTAVIQEMLEGRTFVMGFRLGDLQVVRRKQNPNKPILDWVGTKELRERTGDNTRKKYFTNEYYLAFRWVKKKCTIKNKTAYRFDAALSNTHHNCAANMLNEVRKDYNQYYKFELL